MKRTDLGTTCPTCGGDGLVLKYLTADSIRDSLSRYYGALFPDVIELSDYELLRCGKCSLEFASPMTEDHTQFYSWISAVAGYYPEDRWEWPVVIEEIMQSESAPGSVLEVGCGSGLFLKRLKATAGSIRAIGLDPTGNAVLECRKSGVEAYCETIEQYLANPEHDCKQFDFICAFHCLEHVSRPRELLESMTKLAHRETRIFISTPYSPMSFETSWHDPLNHPPHHLTRWNVAAYKQLASSVGWRVELLMPKAASLISRTLTAVDLSTRGPACGGRGKAWNALSHPSTTLRELLRQMNRERIGARVAPDVILARLQNAAGAVTLNAAHRA